MEEGLRGDIRGASTSRGEVEASARRTRIPGIHSILFLGCIKLIAEQLTIRMEIFGNSNFREVLYVVLDRTFSSRESLN